MKRLGTALVLIPVITWLVLAGPDWAFTAALALANERRGLSAPSAPPG